MGQGQEKVLTKKEITGLVKEKGLVNPAPRGVDNARRVRETKKNDVSGFKREVG